MKIIIIKFHTIWHVDVHTIGKLVRNEFNGLVGKMKFYGSLRQIEFFRCSKEQEIFGYGLSIVDQPEPHTTIKWVLFRNFPFRPGRKTTIGFDREFML